MRKYVNACTDVNSIVAEDLGVVRVKNLTSYEEINNLDVRRLDVDAAKAALRGYVDKIRIEPVDHLRKFYAYEARLLHVLLCLRRHRKMETIEDPRCRSAIMVISLRNQLNRYALK